MRRDAARSTSLRTGYISSDAVSDGFGTDSSLTLGTTVKTLCSRFFALLRMTMYYCSE